MTGTTLFVGWGDTHPGRERRGLKTYEEFVDLLERQKAGREIDDFEIVFLSSHGETFDGFILIHGEPEKLARLMMREDVHRLEMRAHLDHAKFNVFWAVTGDRIPEETALYEEIVS